MRKLYAFLALSIVLLAVNSFGMAELKTGAQTASYIGGVRWEGGNPILTVGTAQPLGIITPGLYQVVYGDVGTGGNAGTESIWFWHPLKKLPLYIGPMAGVELTSPFDAITYVMGSYGGTVTYNMTGAGFWAAYRYNYKFDFDNQNIKSKHTFGFGLYLNIK